VQVEILTRSADTGDVIDVGYVSTTQEDSSWRWGRYHLAIGDVNTGETVINYPSFSNKGLAKGGSPEVGLPVIPDAFMEPLYFSTADTIDIKIKKAALQGKIRLIVHLLEDDR
jgi:hypothetical protein